MIKNVSLLVRKDGMRHAEFVRHRVQTHAPLAHAGPGLRRYVQSHVLEERRRPDIPSLEDQIDGIAELWYDDRESMIRALASPEAKALHAGGALHIGRGSPEGGVAPFGRRIKTFTVEERVIIPDR